MNLIARIKCAFGHHRRMDYSSIVCGHIGVCPYCRDHAGNEECHLGGRR